MWSTGSVCVCVCVLGLKIFVKEFRLTILTILFAEILQGGKIWTVLKIPTINQDFMKIFKNAYVYR